MIFDSVGVCNHEEDQVSHVRRKVSHAECMPSLHRHKYFNLILYPKRVGVKLCSIEGCRQVTSKNISILDRTIFDSI